MDDLIAFVRQFLIADATVIAIFASAPTPTAPTVRAPGGESPDVYPEMVVSGAEGRGQPQGEGGEFARHGSLTITSVDRDADDHLALETVWPLNNQIKFLLAGKEDALTGLTVGGITNTTLPAATGAPLWKVVVCRCDEPSGPQNDPDPLIAKMRQTFKIVLMRV